MYTNFYNANLFFSTVPIRIPSQIWAPDWTNIVIEQCQKWFPQRWWKCVLLPKIIPLKWMNWKISSLRKTFILLPSEKEILNKEILLNEILLPENSFDIKMKWLFVFDFDFSLNSSQKIVNFCQWIILAVLLQFDLLSDSTTAISASIKKSKIRTFPCSFRSNLL